MGKEILYNGIELPDVWPPRYSTEELLKFNQNPPYLTKPPEIVSIDTGRQLFVDDFLVEESDCERIFEKPGIYPGSPVFSPQTDDEMDNGNCPMAAPWRDGVWYDPADGLFKMWYLAGYLGNTALAYSKDGIHWERPQFDVVPGTNLVWPKKRYYERDGGLVWLDLETADPGQRYKMFQFFRYGKNFDEHLMDGVLSVSADGIHWNRTVTTTPVGDFTSFFYNPFRKKWVMSIRNSGHDKEKFQPSGNLRSRAYHECDGFLEGARWDIQKEEVIWQIPDGLDKPDAAFPDHPVALYDFNAAPYESLMLGIYGIFRGPENNFCENLGIPKIIDLDIGFSRDGFHFIHPDRTPFIAASRQEGNWRRCYLHCSGGICLITNDKLCFYFSAFSGNSPKLGKHDAGTAGRMRRVMYAGGSTGLALLRRDGFAAMRAREQGTLTTRKVTFNGKHLFINADCPSGEIKAGVLDESGNVIPGYDRDHCEPVRTDSAKTAVKWSGGDLEKFKGKPVRFRFYISRGKLYSFWVSPSERGQSGGYVAAGGPEFPGSRDC